MQSYGGPPHGYQQPPVKKGTPLITVGAIVAIAGVGMLGFVGLLGMSHAERGAASVPARSLRHPESARVECRGAGVILAAGFACSAHHEEAFQVKMCWTMSITCANGTTGKSADTCTTVAPSGTNSRAVPYDSFHGELERCDSASEMTVGDLRVTPD